MHDPAPGLIERKAFSLPNHLVVVEEKWNIAVPGCPMILNPFVLQARRGWSHWTRRLRLTQDEFNRSGMWLGHQ